MSGITVRAPSPARLRLLEVADDLFTADGILATGVDRIIGEAKVTKATFYKQFGSKDALIREYVEGRSTRDRAALEALAADDPAPHALLAAFAEDVVGRTQRPGFRGDPLVTAAAEYPDPAHPVRVVVAEHRDWLTGFLEDRFRELGHPQAGAAADELVLLRDGALSGASAGDAIAATSAFTRAARRLIG